MVEMLQPACEQGRIALERVEDAYDTLGRNTNGLRLGAIRVLLKSVAPCTGSRSRYEHGNSRVFLNEFSRAMEICFAANCGSAVDQFA